jgi:hypothetical protein
MVEIAVADDPARQLAGEGGATFSALLLGVGGAYLGSQVYPGPGTAVGGVGGAIVGGLVGEEGAVWAYDQLRENEN